MTKADRQRRPHQPVVSLPSGARQPRDTLAADVLLAIEEQARIAPDVTSLRHLVVNETRRLNRARQIFFVQDCDRPRPRVAALSGVGTFDPSSALLEDVGKLLAQARRHENGLGALLQFTLPAYCEDTLDIAKSYPFREMAWFPLLGRSGELLGGMLCARESVWSSDDVKVTQRLAATYAHAWEALAPRPRLRRALAGLSRWRAALALAAVVALALPFPLTALAPAEIVASEPEVVTAPLDGVIEAIEVAPSKLVRTGDVLIRFSDTGLRNKREIALQEVAVAEARVKQATLLAFSDARGRQELGIAQADMELKRAELAFTTAQLDRTVLRASSDGLAVFADARALIGRPVATGERLLEIADPARIEVRIDVAVPDAIALGRDGKVRLFLDVDPLAPRSGRIARYDYKARPSDADVLSFRAFARLDDGRTPPRLGLRGTAQVTGDVAPLAFVILRRPISAIRQWLGW